MKQRVHLLDKSENHRGVALCAEMKGIARDHWPKKEASISVQGFKRDGAPKGQYEMCKDCLSLLKPVVNLPTINK